MKEITKTSVIEYDAGGNIIRKTETIVEKEIKQDTYTNPMPYPTYPSNPYMPYVWYCNGIKTTSGY